MGRVLALVGAALALALAGLALVVYLSRDEDNVAIDNQLAERFSRAVALAANGDRVDLGAVASFPWDHVLIVARGTPTVAISRRIGYPWTGIVGLETGDLMLFERNGRVVRFADYRGEGRFAGIPRPFAELPRARAVFVVRDLVMRPAPPAAPRRGSGG
jgi:hypothetical protein